MEILEQLTQSLSPQATPKSAPVRQKFQRWVNKGSLAIVDQGLISGSNFVVSILLARWLSAELYGAYAVAFGIFVLLTLVYSALILEPMSVFGGAVFRNSLREYLKVLLRAHGALSALMIVGIGAAALAVHEFAPQPDLAGALLGVALAAPCILFLWLVRRALYLRTAPGKAATGAIVYFVLVMGGLWVLKAYSALSAFSALLLMGAAAVAAALVLLALLWSAGEQDREIGPGLRAICQRHWRYGRWALASSVVAWIPAYIFFPLLTVFAGIAVSGQLKALTNFVSPLDQTLAALSLLLLPHVARVNADQGTEGVRGLSRRLLILSTAGAIVYWIAIVDFHRPIFRMLYSGNYSEITHLLPAVAVGSILWSAAYGPAIALRALESPSSVFRAYLVTTIVCIVAGVPAARYFGLKGAIWAGNAADFLSLLAILFLLHWKLRTADKNQPGEICPVPEVQYTGN